MGQSNSTASKSDIVWIKSFGSTRARKNDEEWKDRVDRAKETIAGIEAAKEAERREREAKELAERMKREREEKQRRDREEAEQAIAKFTTFWPRKIVRSVRAREARNIGMHTLRILKLVLRTQTTGATLRTPGCWKRHPRT